MTIFDVVSKDGEVNTFEFESGVFSVNGVKADSLLRSSLVVLEVTTLALDEIIPLNDLLGAGVHRPGLIEPAAAQLNSIANRLCGVAAWQISKNDRGLLSGVGLRTNFRNDYDIAERIGAFVAQTEGTYKRESDQKTITHKGNKAIYDHVLSLKSGAVTDVVSLVDWATDQGYYFDDVRRILDILVQNRQLTIRSKLVKNGPEKLVVPTFVKV